MNIGKKKKLNVRDKARPDRGHMERSGSERMERPDRDRIGKTDGGHMERPDRGRAERIGRGQSERSERGLQDRTDRERAEIADRKKQTAGKKKNNVVHIKGSKEAGEANRRRRRNRIIKRIIIVSVLIIAVIAAVFIAYYNSIREYKGYSVIHSSKTNYEVNASYIKFGENLLKYTPEGVSYINSNGDTEWTAGTNIKVPIASARGNYAAVGDKGGNKVAVFSTEGQISEKTMPYKICDIEVANQGAYVVVLESDKTNYINMYTSNGDIVYEMQTSIDKSGYPVDITISNDGKKLFTSYFLVEGLSTTISLTAYNFGEVGQNSNADRMVGGYRFNDELIPKVEFLTNDTIAAFSDKHIYVYKMKEIPSPYAAIEIDGEAKSIFYSKEFVGIIQKKDNGYVMKIYDLNGRQRFTYDFNMEYDNIFASEDEIILTGGRECLIVTKSGRTRFHYIFDQQIRNMISTSGYHQYIVSFEDHTDTIKLRAKDSRKKSQEPVQGTEDKDKKDTGKTSATEKPDGKTTEKTTDKSADNTTEKTSEDTTEKTEE
ncbi:MAG: DUF5711 family protein [Eubacterium sp.]|nr:DUF5711 family protein [Eubacterium sp.]